MAGLSKGEISSRHFVDLSDTSFQIPVNFGNDTNDLLTATNVGDLWDDDDDQEFAALAAHRNDDESIYVPRTSARASALHAANQLSPTPKSRRNSRSRSQTPTSRNPSVEDLSLTQARAKGSRLPMPASRIPAPRANKENVPGTVARQRTASFTSSIPVPKSLARSRQTPATEKKTAASETAPRPAPQSMGKLSTKPPAFARAEPAQVASDDDEVPLPSPSRSARRRRAMTPSEVRPLADDSMELDVQETQTVTQSVSTSARRQSAAAAPSRRTSLVTEQEQPSAEGSRRQSTQASLARRASVADASDQDYEADSTHRTTTSARSSYSGSGSMSMSTFPNMGDVTNIADMTNLGDMTNFGGEDYTAEDMEMDTTIPVGELSFDSEQLLAQLEAERLQLRAELDRQRALQDAPAPAMSNSPVVAPIGRAQRVPAPASRPASPVQEASAPAPTRAARVSTGAPSRQASPVRPALAPPARRASRVLAPPIEVPQPAPPSRRSSIRMPGAAVWDEEVLVPVEERRTSLARPPTPPPVRRRASVVEETAPPRRESVARAPNPPPARRPEPVMTKRASIAPVPVEQPAPPRRESVARVPSPPARHQSFAVQPQATSTATRRVVSPPPARPVAVREEQPAAAQLAPRRVSVVRQPTPPAPARRESVHAARPASPEVLVQPPPSRRGSVVSTHQPSPQPTHRPAPPPPPPQSARFEDVFMDDDDEEEENYNFAQDDEDKTVRTRRGSASVYSYEPAQPKLYPTLDAEPPRPRPSRAHTVYYEPTPATSRPSMSYHEDRMQISPPRLRRPSAGVLPTFLEQQQRVDDMFQRRVRDSNSHKGVELSPERLSRPASALDMQSGTRSRANSFTSRSRPASPVMRSRSMSRSRPASPVSRSRSRSRPASPVTHAGRSMSAAPDLSFHEERPSRPTSRAGGYAGPTATSKSRTAPRRSTSVPPPQSRKEAPKSRPAAKTTTSTTTSSRLMKETASSRARALRDKDVNKAASRRGEVDRERGRTKDVKKDLNKTSTSTTASRPPATAASKPPAARPRQEQKKKPVEVAKAVSARTAPRGILKAKPTTKPKLPASQLTRALAAKPSGSGSRPKLRDALAEPVEKQDANSGPAFADVIAKYGERLLKASGLAWITDPQAENTTAPASAPAATVKPTVDTAPRTAQLSDREADGDEEASDSEPEHDPYRAMTLDDLSPRKRRAMHHQEDLQHHHPSFVTSPMRPSFKRSSDSYSPEPYKRARPPPSSPTPSSSPPSPEPPRARSRSRSRGPERPLSRNGVAGGSMSREREFRGSGSVASQMVASASWDMPGYANKQRVLEKLEIERMRKELEAQARRAAGAPDYPVVPVIAPAHHTGTKPTVTQPFTFQASRQQRKEDFEAKRQLWQERSQSVQSHASSHSSRSAPDFGSIHAANAASLASRRPKPQPTVPAAPKLSTTTRARERERYEEGHRERERIVEEYRAERRRLREMEEEREYREMRKRTVPKAHEVPGWYAEAPKRSVSGDARRR